MQSLGDAPAVEAQQLAARVARQVQRSQAPHRRGIVVDHRDLEQVSQRCGARDQRHGPAEGLRRQIPLGESAQGAAGFEQQVSRVILQAGEADAA